MGSSKNTASIALFLSLNILFFSLASSCNTCPGSKPNPNPNPNNPNNPNPNNPNNPNPNNPNNPNPNNPNNPNPNNPNNPNPNNPNPNNPNPNPNNPNPTPNPNNRGRCPRDALKLGVCADVLNLVNNVIIGSPPTLPCCSLLQGLVNLEAAICLCTAIRANILGINLNVPVSLSLVLNNCGRRVPNGFQCN